MKRVTTRDKLRQGLHGISDVNDRLWRISNHTFVAGLTEYNYEITGFAPILKKIFSEKVIHYGGNAYYVLNEARTRGYLVEEVEDRYIKDDGEKTK